MIQGVVQPDQREGPVAKSIERQTAKIPSDIFLWAAFGALAASAAAQAMNSKHRSLFIGQWVPTLLLLGVYNKIVKVAGSDKYDPANSFDHTHQFEPE